jgi:ribosome recycling factor
MVYDKNAIANKMEKTISVLVSDFGAIRAGRANPAILDRIHVDYYGVPTQINQMAAISVIEARTLSIQPWDMSTIKSIEKAINASDIGINPQNDGKVIRLSFPPLTEERRKEIVKTIHKHAEESKVAIRSIRRDIIEDYKEMKKKNLVTEDELKIYENDVQDLTDKFCKEIDVLAQNKEKEIMSV